MMVSQSAPPRVQQPTRFIQPFTQPQSPSPMLSGSDAPRPMFNVGAPSPVQRDTSADDLDDLLMVDLMRQQQQDQFLADAIFPLTMDNDMMGGDASPSQQSQYPHTQRSPHFDVDADGSPILVPASSIPHTVSKSVPIGIQPASLTQGQQQQQRQVVGTVSPVVAAGLAQSFPASMHQQPPMNTTMSQSLGNSVESTTSVLMDMFLDDPDDMIKQYVHFIVFVD